MSTTDLPPFLNAANEARVGTIRWWGDVILGPDAIYIFQTRPARGRGLLDVFEALADRFLLHQELPGGPYDDIPATVRNDPRWPVRGPASSPVLIVPRTAVEFLHHQRGRLEVRFIIAGVEVSIPHGRFGAKRLKTFLQTAGWPLIWDGEPINLPTPAAMEYRSTAWANPFRPPHLSYKLIAGGFALGVLPTATLLLPRIDPALQFTVYAIGWFGGAALILFGWIASRRGL